MLELLWKRFEKKDDGQSVIEIPLYKITPNPSQPRRHFDRASLAELAESILEYGVIQPITVRENGGEYELIAGERRWRASYMAGLETIPAIVMEADKEESALLALLENLQREDLSFFEIAESYRRLIHEQGMTQEDLASKLGKSQSSISNKLRLLRLDPMVRKMIREYGLSERHARALLSIADPLLQLEAARKICDEKMTVSQSEDYIKSLLIKHPRMHETRRNVSSARDIKVFTNTIKKAVDTMKKGGVEANLRQTETDAGIEYTITVKKESSLNKE